MLALIFSGLVLISQSALAQSFSSGNDFQSQNIRGRVSVSCFGQRPGFVTYFCEQEILNPGELDYFVGPAGIDADIVELRVVRENGSVKSKSGKYDSAKGRSKDRFNLWIATLLQKPLLDLGKNKVTYQMTKAGNSVAHGNFDVNVARLPGLVCRRPPTPRSNACLSARPRRTCPLRPWRACPNHRRRGARGRAWPSG